MSSKDILGLGWTTEGATAIAAADRHKLLSITDSGTKSLPALADVDRGWSCLVFAEHSSGITLDPDGSEQINGASTIDLGQYGYALIYKIDATNWGAMIKGDRGAVDNAEIEGSGTTYSPAGSWDTDELIINNKNASALERVEIADLIGLGVVMDTYIASSDSQIDIDLATPSAGDVFTVVLNRLVPATDDVRLLGRIGDSGGTHTGAADYDYTIHGINASDGGDVKTWDPSADNFRFSQQVGSESGEAVSGIIRVYNLGDASHKTVLTWNVVYATQSDILVGLTGVARYKTANADTELSLFFESGNIASGEITSYLSRRS